MNIALNKSQALAQYSSLKASLKEMAPDTESVKAQGDQVTISQDVVVKSDGGDVTVKAGSHFDNDLTTEDSVSFSYKNQDENGSLTLNREFTHSSRKRFWFFTTEKLEVETGYTQQTVNPPSHSSVATTNTFEY